MMPVDFYASQPQYADHLAPLFHALSDDERGEFYVGLNRHELGPPIAQLGITVSPGRPSNAEGDPVIVAAAADLWACQSRPAVLLEHGAGQSYVGHASPSYSGGPGRESVALFLCTNEMVAAKNRAVYPRIPSVVCGSPRLDIWNGFQLTARTVGAPEIGFTFHWDYPNVPETRASWSYWYDAVATTARRHWTWGHAHPKIARAIMPIYPRLGVTPVPNYDAILAFSAVLCCDNSSALYERAALDLPVVVLNAPWYRRDVEHGLRFWEYADVGVQCDGPDALPDAIEQALEDPPEVAARRREIANVVYPHLGEATARALDAIRAVEPRPHRSAEGRRRTA
jgi:hypothetical protein